MTKLCAILALFATVAIPGPIQAEENKKVEQELRKLDEEVAKAYVKGDVAAMERVLAEDFIFTDPMGGVGDRKTSITEIKSGKLAFESMVSADVRVRVYGQTAVVTGRSTVKGKADGHDISGQYRFTDVYVMRDGRWQCVAGQITRIAKP